MQLHYAVNDPPLLSMTEVLLGELLETGQMRYKDDTRLWVAKAMEGRNGNLV